jgi:C1A family cysteine protease
LTDIKHGLGCIPGKPDPRNYIFVPEGVTGAGSYPASKSFQGFCGTVMNQGQTNACVAFALQSQLFYHRTWQNRYPKTLSRKQIYWNARAVTGNTGNDIGCIIGNAFAQLKALGACNDGQANQVNSYSPDNYMVAPTAAQVAEAATHKGGDYIFINRTVNDMQAALQFTPFVIGIKSYQSLSNPQGGYIPWGNGVSPATGGHALLVVGYDDSRQAFRVQNSYGTGWGEGGYAWISYGYLTSATEAYDACYMVQTA